MPWSIQDALKLFLGFVETSGSVTMVQRGSARPGGKSSGLH